MKFSIYLATSPSGKQYVGMTRDFHHRVINHYATARKFNKYPFQRALNKYGKQVRFEEILQCWNEFDAFKFEEYFINEFNTRAPNGYNATSGGEGGAGICGEKHHWFGKPGFWTGKKRPDIAKKISQAFTGRKLSEEHKRKIAEGLSKADRKGWYNSNKERRKPIYCPELDVCFLSISAASKYLNVNSGRIHEAIIGKVRKRVRGFHFYYMKDHGTSKGFGKK